MSAAADALRAGLGEPLAAIGVDLESVEVQQAGRRHIVRVAVDRDGGIDLDLVAQVSRLVADLLDVPPLADHLPGPFVLEVSSPGVDRPLTEPRHWRRAVTRLVHVARKDGTVVEGRVVSVPSDGFVLLTTDAGDVEVALADVRRAVVQIEFNRADAVVDADGADDAGDEDTDDGEG